MSQYELYAFKRNLDAFLEAQSSSTDKMSRMAFQLLTIPRKVQSFYQQFKIKMKAVKAIKLMMLVEFCLNKSVRLDSELTDLLGDIKLKKENQEMDVGIVRKYICFLQKRIHFKKEEMKKSLELESCIFHFINLLNQGIQLNLCLMSASWVNQSWIKIIAETVSEDLRRIYADVKEAIEKVNGQNSHEYSLILPEIQKINQKMVYLSNCCFKGYSLKQHLPLLIDSSDYNFSLAQIALNN